MGIGTVWYSNRDTKAVFYTTGFLLTGAFLGYSIYNWNDKRKTYEDEDYKGLTTSQRQALHDKNYNETRKAFKQANIALGIFAGFYLLNWIDVLFFSKPDMANKNADMYLNTIMLTSALI